MNELKSYTEYAVSTPTADFVIGFNFNYGEDAVNVTVDDVPATEAGYTVVYLNETTIRLSPSVPSGVVRLQRETDIDQTDHAYRAGAKFIAQTMDENFEQLRHSQQEVRDGFVKLADDTYEIIDTLEEVGKSAQDAADAAEVAAELANSAAAQVNDKVSYEDFNNKPHNAMLGRDAASAHPTSSILDASGETQQQVNYNGGTKWHSRVGGYQENERVVLANSDIVKSTIDGNTNNPNVDMTGWVNTSNNISIVKTIADLIEISNPQDGDVVYVKGYYAPTNFALAKPYIGGGVRVYVESRKTENDGFLCINGWVLQIQDGVVTPEQAGAKGDMVQDDAPFIRTVIDSLSKAGGGVINLTGKYLLNSYRAEGSTDIFALEHNITFQGVSDSHFFVGNFFHDKPVIVFSNQFYLTTPLKNVWFKDVRITSDIASNHLVSSFHLRVGVHFQSAVDCGYVGGSIDNFDCLNAIISGWIDKNGWSGTVGADLSGKVVVDGCYFNNLTYNSDNYDHTTCYILSPHSVVKNCTFMGNTQTQKVGCPTELHNSHSSFIDNFVAGYTRGVWLVSQEKPNITNQLVSRNVFYITNHMTIISAEAGVLSNCRVLDNYCECSHPVDFEMTYITHQGLFISSVQLAGAEATDFEYARNTVKIKSSRNKDLATAFNMEFFATNFHIHGNNIYGANCFNIKNTSTYGWDVSKNTFHNITGTNNAFGFISNVYNNVVSNFQFYGNTLQYLHENSANNYTLEFDTSITSIISCSISDNKYSQKNPQIADIKFPSATIDLSDSNKLDVRYFNCSGVYSVASANSWGVLSITQPQAFPFRTRAEVVYSPPSERMLAGIAHYHGASSIKIPFYVESDVLMLSENAIEVRFIVG